LGIKEVRPAKYKIGRNRPVERLTHATVIPQKEAKSLFGLSGFTPLPGCG
jgi:hypothetical protein